MRSPTCPRLSKLITTRQRQFRHLTKKDIRRMIRHHTCPECKGYTVPPGLARDPRDDPKGDRP